MQARIHSVIFETERLYVRPYSMSDLDLFCKLNGDEEVMRYIRPVQNREQSEDFLTKILAAYIERPGLGRWAMFKRSNDQFVGSFAVIPVNNSVDIQLGYALLKDNWGNGYASESVRGGIQYAFHQYGLENIAGITQTGNTASQKVLIKNGFVFEKTFIEESTELYLYRLQKERVS